MRAQALRAVSTALLATVLAACGTSAPAAVVTRPASPVATSSPAPLAVELSPSPTAAPSAVPAVAPLIAPPPAPVAAPAPAPMPMARAESSTFPLVAVGDSSARGLVTVTTQSGRAAVLVSVTGLPPGTVHSVHLHFGNCPSAGSHILVLGTLRADGAGSGSVADTVNSVFVGAGHFVIIYVGPAAGPLGACANLG